MSSGSFAVSLPTTPRIEACEPGSGDRGPVTTTEAESLPPHQ
jgi:hypothetical protein